MLAAITSAAAASASATAHALAPAAGPATGQGPEAAAMQAAKEPREFEVGDSVSWKGADTDLPAGTVGRVIRVNSSDNDVEV